jgi:hypothetical protein
MPSLVHEGLAALPDFDAHGAPCTQPGTNPNWWTGSVRDFGSRQFYYAAMAMARGRCTPCPVRARCLAWGQSNLQTGVWGGEHLVAGRVGSLVRTAASRAIL